MLHVVVARQCRPRFGTKAGHNIEGPVWQAGILTDTAKGQRGQAGLFGGFQNTGIAHGQGSAHAAPDDLHRIVPGHDMPGDPMRLAQGIDGVAVQIGDGFTRDLVGRPAVKFHVAGKRHGICARLTERLAHVMRFDHGKCVHMLQNAATNIGQEAATFRGCHPTPVRGSGGMCCHNRCVNILGRAARNFRKRAAV